MWNLPFHSLRLLYHVLKKETEIFVYPGTGYCRDPWDSLAHLYPTIMVTNQFTILSLRIYRSTSIPYNCFHLSTWLHFVSVISIVVLFFFSQGKRKGTKLAYRICESIITDWNVLICRLFHKQKNPKIGLLLLCMSPFLCTLSIKAWSNTAAYSWVDGISTINTISTISLPSWTFSFRCIFG